MRFVAYNHYVHKVFRRWGPNFRELLAIRRYLEQQQIDMEDLPLVGGMEIDLPGLFHTVQRLGGLNDVIASRRWPAVADLINMPKCAQDRAVKLEQIYLKYLVGYTMLTEGRDDARRRGGGEGSLGRRGGCCSTELNGREFNTKGCGWCSCRTGCTMQC